MLVDSFSSSHTPDVGFSQQLAADATYDDQGLYFSLVLGAITLITLGAVICYLNTSNKLWIFRLYRPNHTGVEVSERDASQWHGVRLPFRSSLFSPPSWSDWWRVEERDSMPHVYSAFTPWAAAHATTSTASSAVVHSVPASSGRDDEKADDEEYSARSATGEAGDEEARQCRRGGGEDAAAALRQQPAMRSGDGNEDTNNSNVHSKGDTNNNDHIDASRNETQDHTSSKPLKEEEEEETTVPMIPRGCGGLGRHGSHGAASERGGRPDAEDTRGKHTASDGRVRGGAPPRGERLVDASCATGRSSTQAFGRHSSAPPTTPIDPQIAVYLFTLKYFATTMLAGCVFTGWIALLASRDDYIREYTIRSDVHRCQRQGHNATACRALAPYCRYVSAGAQDAGDGERGSCATVALPGLYDMTTQNIHPASSLWWGVLGLNTGFCLVFVLATVYFVHTVSAYVRLVRHAQLRHALGHRVVCVRGLSRNMLSSLSQHQHANASASASASTGWLEEDCPTEQQEAAVRDEFVKRYVEESNYFAPRATPEQTDGTRRSNSPSSGSSHRPCYTNYHTMVPNDTPGDTSHGHDTNSNPIHPNRCCRRSSSSSSSHPSEDAICPVSHVDTNSLMGHHSARRESIAIRIHSSDESNSPHGAAGRVMHRSDEAEEDYYERVDCTGLRCVFTNIGWTYDRTYRRDAAMFTHAGAVRRVLVIREPPPGMYRSIRRAEQAMAEMQEMVAWMLTVPHGGDVRACSGEVHEERPTRTAAPAHRERAGRDDAEGAAGHHKGQVDHDGADAADCGAHPLLCGGGARRFDPWYARYLPWLARRNDPERRYAHARKALATALEEMRVHLATVPRQPAQGMVCVIFAHSRAAYEFVQLFNIRFGRHTLGREASIAGPANRIIVQNWYTSHSVLLVRYVTCLTLFVVLLFTWSIPVGFLGSLDSIARIPGVGPAFRVYYATRVPQWLQSIATAYLPVLALALFNVVLPFLMHSIVIAMGARNGDEAELGHLHLQYLFMVLTGVIFQAALQGGLTQLANLLANTDRESVMNLLAACVTATGGYWYAKVVTSTTVAALVEVIDPMPLLEALLRRRRLIQRCYDALFERPTAHLALYYSADMVVMAIGLVFHMTTPLLVGFVSCYFVVRYHVQRGRLYDRCRPTLMPERDCTNFALSAQVIRSTTWLFCLGEMGAVVLMSLRGQRGGVGWCSVTLAVGLGLQGYVHVRSNHWVTTLSRVREESDGAVESVLQSAKRQSVKNTAMVGQGGGGRAEEKSAGANYGFYHRYNRRVNANNKLFVAECTRGGPRWAAVDEEAEEEEESVVSGGNDYDPHFSIFGSSHEEHATSDLLPLRGCFCSRYYPKHQRLEWAKVTEQARRLCETCSYTSRYWEE